MVHPARRTEVRAVLVTLLVLIALLAADTSHDIFVPLGRSVAGPSLVATASPTLVPTLSAARARSGDIPDGRIFCLRGITTVIPSAYAYEANLLDGATPVADLDYRLPDGVSEWACLPGGSWRHYQFIGFEYIQGSGIVQKWVAPNGGRFDLLHMRTAPTRGANEPSLAYLGGQPSTTGEPGIDSTALFVAQATPSLLSSAANLDTGAASFTGHTVAGLTGWPDWAQYCNGSVTICGSRDAHMCLLLDARALAWFMQVSDGRDYPPFPIRAWRHYRVTHHLPDIAYRLHGALTWAASAWLSRQWLGGIRSKGSWHPGQPGFMRYDFEHGRLYCFPATHRCKATRQ